MLTTTTVDIAIIGGGMVGMATALGLAQQGFKVAVVDKTPPTVPEGEPELRVSAINRASENWLKSLGAWQRLPQTRVSTYDAMFVWDKDSIGRIEFDAASIGQPDLGHIIENSALSSALWQHAEDQKGLSILVAKPTGLAIGERETIVTLDDGTMLTAQLLVAADGANSWVRQQCRLPLIFRDYGHHALVATVKTQHPHARVARQVFLSEGPLALLPLSDPNLCSIVWSSLPSRSNQLATMSDEEFAAEISMATDARLGHIQLMSERLVFPLKMRYARDFVRPRLALVGDAAHTIHPLAGQGVNLGFGDSKTLVEVLAKSQQSDPGSLPLLNQYGRARKAAAQEMLAAMDGFRWLFAGDNLLKRGIRDFGLNLFDRATPIKRRLLGHALGLQSRDYIGWNR